LFTKPLTKTSYYYFFKPLAFNHPICVGCWSHPFGGDEATFEKFGYYGL